MPLPKRIIQPLAFAPNGVVQEPEGQVLETVAEMGMQIALEQLSHLASFSQEIFKGLLDISNSYQERINNLSQRAQNLAQKSYQAESFFAVADPWSLFKNRTADVKTSVVEDQQLFTKNSVPVPLQAIYETANPCPNLGIMDIFADEGKSCLKVYTNPSFFIDQWVTAQLEAREKMKEDAKKRKKKPKAKGEAQKKPKVIQAIGKRVYNPLGREFDAAPQPQRQVSSQAIAGPIVTGPSSQSPASAPIATPGTSFSSTPPPLPNSTPPMASTPPGLLQKSSSKSNIQAPPPPTTPPPPLQKQGSKTAMSGPPPVPSSPPPLPVSAPPLPGPTPPPRVLEPPPLPSSAPPGIRIPPPVNSAPPNLQRMPPPVSSPPGVKIAPPVGPPPPLPNSAPPLPMSAPPPFNSMAPPLPITSPMNQESNDEPQLSGFAAQLAAAKLRKADPKQAPLVNDPRHILMEQIRQGKQLHKTSDRKVSAAPAKTAAAPVQGFDVAAILQRTMQIRQAVELSDSEEEEGDEEAWD